MPRDTLLSGNVETCDVETCDVETCDVETCDVETCDVETCDVCHVPARTVDVELVHRL